jgi:hypothetical protein
MNTVASAMCLACLSLDLCYHLPACTHSSILISLSVVTFISSVPHGKSAHTCDRRNMHLHDVVRGESGRSELRDVSLGSAGLTVQVEGDLLPGKIHAEGPSQLVLDGLFGGREAESVAHSSLNVTLGRNLEAVDGESRHVFEGVAESEYVLRRSGRGVCDSYHPALLPLAQSLGGGSLYTLSEDEVDLVRSGGDLINADVLESLQLLLLRAGLVGRGRVVDADGVVLRIDAESDQDVELEFCGPAGDGLLTLRVGQPDGLVVRDLDRCGLLTGEGARADVDRSVDVRAAESRSHGDWFMMGCLDYRSLCVVMRVGI